MLFSLKQLNRLVDLSSLEVKDIVSRLTFSGFEVEGVETMANGSKLIIGEILTCVAHPDSDHLHLLTVDCGKEEGVLNIVCGAPNARVGLKVIVALPGCELKALNTTIEKGSIRGQESCGMCCSLAELGVDKEILSEKQLSGIEELPLDAPVGCREVLSYLSLDDTILDINVLPNRPDCLSYLGMAREIAALLDRKLYPVPTFENKYSSNLTVTSKSKYCNRFDALKVCNIKAKKEIPSYIKHTLEANGIRSLSPLVDLGNYSMLITGQPLNIYDADLNPSNHYEVIDDFNGKFETFDGKELDLINGDLVVSNGNENLCLAGIMAGKKASCNESTKNIVIEAASFYHANIRHTSNRLGLSSFSQQLFTKGRNPRCISEAIAVTISLLDEFFESYEVCDYASFDNSEKESPEFKFSLEKLNARLGSDYTKEQVDKVLKVFNIEKVDENTLKGPYYRVDLLEQCDIDEEVFRYYPADYVKPSLNNFPLSHGELSYQQKMKREIREMLVNHGLDEILSFTLISEKEDKSIRVFSDKESYRVVNPMTKDHEFVRSDLLPSMLDTINYNISHQHDDLALFEVSPIDTKDGVKLYLSIGLHGKKALTESYLKRDYNFFDMKGLVENIFAKLGLNENRYKLEYSKNKVFHPKASCDVYCGKTLVGTFGQLHPSFSSEVVLLCELDLGYLLSLKGGNTKFKSYSNLPFVSRDLSLKMNDKCTYADVKKVILRTKDTYVTEVELFDEFKDKITGDVYVGVKLKLQKDEGTLKDAEITSCMNNTISAIKEQLGLKLRGE